VIPFVDNLNTCMLKGPFWRVSPQQPQRQEQQKTSAHIVTYHQPKRPTNLHLFNVHCLTNKQGINFKIATLTYKTLATGHSGYLLYLLNTYQPVHSLHSQDKPPTRKPSVYTSIGHRAFSFATPQIWNAIL